MMIFKMGNILRCIRCCNELSIKEAASRMNTTLAFLSDIENNRKNITLAMLNRISICYNIEVSKIFYLYELEQKGMSRQEILEEILKYYKEKEEVKSL